MFRKILPLIIVIVLLGAVGYAFYVSNKAIDQNDINRVYKPEDFPVNNQKDPEGTIRLVGQLNRDFGFLRDGSEFSNYDLWIDIANLKYGMSDWVGAEASYFKAISINDKNPLAYLNLGTLHKLGTHNYPLAEQYYLKAMGRITTPYYSDYESFADLYVNFWKERQVDVESIMLQGANNSPEVNRPPYYSYLYMYFKDRDQTKSEEYKTKVLELDPNFNLPL